MSVKITGLVTVRPGDSDGFLRDLRLIASRHAKHYTCAYCGEHGHMGIRMSYEHSDRVLLAWCSMDCFEAWTDDLSDRELRP